jgi:hypothetical protein
MVHIAALLIALAVGLAAELVGVWRHQSGKVDTYTELVHWTGQRLGPFRFAAGVALSAFLVWAIPHLWFAMVGLALPPICSA